MFQPWHNPAKIQKLNAQQRAEIVRLANDLFAITSDIKTEFLAAIDRLATSINAEEIIAYLQSGRIVQAIASVEAGLFGEALTPLAQEITNAVLRSGKSAAQEIPTEQAFSFGVQNPLVVRYLDKYGFGLIKELSDEGRKAVGITIKQGMAAGLNPITIARDVRANIGLTARQAQAVVNYRLALQAGNTSALTRQLRNRTFDGTVRRAATNGVPLSQDKIDKMVADYQKRYLKYRAETIARTEGARAQSYGNHEAWQQAIDNGSIDEANVVREWIYTHDQKTRDAHRTIDQLNPDGVGWGEPFKSDLGDIMFPGDPDAEAANTINCRCSVFLRYRPK